MNYPSIDIQGNIVTADLLDQLSELENGAPFKGQRPAEFDLGNESVRDAIALAYSTAKKQYSIIKERKDKAEGTLSVSDTRNFWMIPFFNILGYELEHERAHREADDQSFSISHGATNRDGFPINIITWGESLDQRLQRRYSTHAEMQLYLNATEHLYAFVSNGSKLRLLRDSTKLTALTYVEFDLELMMEEDLSADFSVLYRLCHVTRMPEKQEEAEASLIEEYHLKSSEDGERIREKLGQAIISGLEEVGTALLQHPNNTSLREAAANGGDEFARALFAQLLKLVYRILFLLVIEERGLVFKRNKEGDALYQLYYEHYSLKRLRKLAENRVYLDLGAQDLWNGLLDTFTLFEREDLGAKLSVPALAGGIFSEDVLSLLKSTSLKNEALLSLINGLSWFEDRKTRRRVNYGALNVEEFGSVYEGLLALDPEVSDHHFGFKEGKEREKTGSHYTPDDLVKPLLDHALDPVMEQKITEAGDNKQAQERAILSMNVVDTAAGSGHFLLGAARRMALRLAQIRTGEEQPSAQAQRSAKREIIANCIYAVDRNEMAVELCKVALWLEAHDPGTTLAFLDHKVRWGDSLVGIERVSELREAIPDVAFKAVTPLDKEENRLHQVAKNLAARNKKQAKAMKGALQADFFEDPIKTGVNQLSFTLASLSDEGNLSYEAKRALWDRVNSEELDRLRSIANARLCGFFADKTNENYANIPTTEDVRRLLSSGVDKDNPKVQLANQVADQVKMFHWEIEFADVMSAGGFDVVLGNPPFLGYSKISGSLSLNHLTYLKESFKPAKAIDLCGYFFRRNYNILNQSGRFGLIATNTIAQGGTRQGGLAIIEQTGSIIYANPNINWPGLGATVTISLIAVSRQAVEEAKRLRNNWVANINSYLSDEEMLPDPYPLSKNLNLGFEGSYPLGSGFVLSIEEAKEMIEADPRNKKVIFPYLIGKDVNSRFDQSPSRWVINFFDWPIEKAMEYILPFQRIKKLVYPERTRWKKDKNGNDIVGTYALRKPLPQKWWIYGEKRPGLYKSIESKDQIIVFSFTTKHLDFIRVKTGLVYSKRLGVISEASNSILIQLRSNLNTAWAWKYCPTMGAAGLVYTLKNGLETYPRIHESILSADKLAAENEALRKELCQSKDIGLTKIYNEFHDPGVTEPTVQRLRDNHVAIDQAVAKAYGWDDIKLGHDFHEMEYLPENDRVRFTICLEARKEVLRRLLLLNHERYEQEKKGK